MANKISRKRKRTANGGRQYAKRPRYTTARNAGKGYARAIRNVPMLGRNIVKSIHTYSIVFGKLYNVRMQVK